MVLTRYLLLTAHWSLLTVSSFAFVVQCLLDRLTHKLGSGCWTEAFEVFHDAAVARNDEALRNYTPGVYQLDQRRRQRSIIPDDLVINILRFNVILDVRWIVMLVVCRGQSKHDQAARLVLVVHLHQLRHLQSARSAPRGPDIHH